MASILTLRAQLVARLRAGYPTGIQIYPRNPDLVVCPAIVVVPSPGDFVGFDTTMGRGSDDIYFVVKVLVDTADSDTAQKRLDEFIDTAGTTSIKAVVDHNGSAGGPGDFAMTRKASSYGDVEHNGQVYFGAEFLVEVRVRP